MVRFSDRHTGNNYNIPIWLLLIDLINQKVKLYFNISPYIFSICAGYIDVGDGCWRRPNMNFLPFHISVTNFRLLLHFIAFCCVEFNCCWTCSCPSLRLQKSRVRVRGFWFCVVYAWFTHGLGHVFPIRLKHRNGELQLW